MKKPIGILFILISMIACNSKVDSDLGLYLEAGTTYYQNMTQDIVMITESNGAPVSTKMMVEGSMSFTVKEVSDQGYDIDIKYEKLNMEMGLAGEGGATMKISSENPKENDPMGQILNGIVGVEFAAMINKKGKVISLANIDEIINGLLSNMTGIPDYVKPQLQGQLSEAFGSESLKTSLEQSIAIFPEAGARVGAKWTSTSNLHLAGMTGSTINNFELFEIGEEEVHIKVTSTIVADTSAAGIEMAGANIKTEINGTMNSDIYFVKSTGWIKKAVITQDVKGRSIITGLPQGNIEQPIDMQAETTIVGS